MKYFLKKKKILYILSLRFWKIEYFNLLILLWMILWMYIKYILEVKIYLILVIIFVLLLIDLFMNFWDNWEFLVIYIIVRY